MINFENIYDFRAEHISFRTNQIIWKVQFHEVVCEFENGYSLTICEDRRLEVTASFAFCVITFESIEIQTHSAPQNDSLNPSFVKDAYVNGGKLARNGQKTAILVGGLGQFPIDNDICTTFLKSLWQKVC